MRKSDFIILTFISIIIFSCSKSSEDNYTDPDPPGGGNNNCDTANMEYQADVVPILSAYCYSCHGQTTNSGSNGIILEGYNNIKTRADNGTLLGVITHAAGYPAMPMNAPKLSACNINKIRSWIDHGAKDN